MNADNLKALLEKIQAGTASESEKLEATKEANALLEELNKALRESLAQNP